MSDRVIIFDTTLRDGEQSPGIALDADDKLAIARQLAKLRVDVIEAGFPASSDGDFAAVRQIARNVRGVTIAGLARTLPEDIDRCWEAVKDADKPRIHVFLSTSQVHMEHMIKMTHDEVREAVRDGVARARSYCDDVEFSPQDATRTDHDFLIEVCKIAVDSGATTINIPDTVGYGTPSDFGALIRRVVEEVKGDRDDIIVSTHCHNDLGLAVANSLAGVENGARQVEGAINGIGERAGNTSVEEVVMALNTRRDHFGLDVGVDTTELFETSRLVSRLTAYPVQYNKAVVGRNAFGHESGIHQHGVLAERTTYEIMDPVAVGQAGTMIVLGKHSGRAGFGDALKKMDIVLEDDDFEAAFQRFKHIADLKGEIGEAGIRAIVDAASIEAEETVRLVGLQVAGGGDTPPSAKVKVDSRGLTLEFDAEGDGMVDAAFGALRKAFGVDARLVDYRVDPITPGADAMATVNVVIRMGGETYSGRGVSSDVVEGSALAFVAALNKAAKQVLEEAVSGDE
jgi:2-isopropylmalate synthase